MKVSVDVSATGFEDIVKAWDDFGGNIDTNLKEGVSGILGKIERAMSTNVTTMFNKGYMTGVLANSVSHTSRIGDDGGVYGTVGVYDMSNKTGSNDRRATAPMLAHFYEHGIRPHSLAPGVKLEQLPTLKNPRGRKAVGEQTNPIHPGSTPIPFLSSAWDSYSESITPALINNMDKEIKKL
jgi:hypothetical protein